ncbi:Protein CER1-like 1 [Hibiscus syriacus]|uniref:Protein CER1-like 1 n=1 Tax=Hibiscus syriacus TaxID=106335 RepID=A0A6A2ZHI9_HIBSY|nr:very-long-chain aldehyde decarbonylase CER1-like [Hibiscus syriacus]KAE8691060.1 Protein CER1-like 1 [Hibiscus syriacus]
MASKPGILSDWPWQSMGNFKYALLVPGAIYSTYMFITCKDEKERNWFMFLILPFLVFRLIHYQLWISYSRYRTAKGNNRILDKSIDFEQVDRERTWDDQILLNGLLFYGAGIVLKDQFNMPFFKADGTLIILLLHWGPAEFLYYWLHRALHHHYLYARYHSHHHSSIVTEPNTSFTHPMVEVLAYYGLLLIPTLVSVYIGKANIVGLFTYVTVIDFLNNMGHCNFEFIPKWVFTIFPPLKYIVYTPSFHSLHHTKFRTNYSLFCPFYDYAYGTVDVSTDTVYETALKRAAESPDVVHLTHLTTPDSIYHLPLGFPSLSSKPQASKWYLLFMWPVTVWSMLLTWAFGHAFLSERNAFKKLKLQAWVVPKYNMQYSSKWQRETISKLIGDAIQEADKKGAKVLSLGLLNQREEFSRNVEIYMKNNPQLNIKVVDGRSLVAAIVLNSIPKETTQVLLRGRISKDVHVLVQALCQKGIKAVTVQDDEYKELLKSNNKIESNLILSKTYDIKVWLVGDGLTDKEQSKAPKGTLFIPFSIFPPKKVRKDCYYHSTPAMMAPASLENMNSCEDWLPRKVMSASRVAGIVHASEGFDVNECGGTIFSIDKVWEASLENGFCPLPIPS